MGFFSFLLLATVAYLVWRISDQLPDLLFRITEIQRDVADMRKQFIAANETAAQVQANQKKPAKKRAAKKVTAKTLTNDDEKL